ncbi:TPA: GNAT family N-acetyltransferase, partial [Legionella pneumophila]|nr:GNAT family N-acetyltransferase [Legionella pneumophila]
EILVYKNYVIKENNEVVAGINAKMYMWGILFIDILFIAESHRKKQLGTYLLCKVEDEAKKAGATLVHLDTFDFQAKDFYLKHGYEIFGVLDNCPPGHQRFYLKKTL